MPPGVLAQLVRSSIRSPRVPHATRICVPHALLRSNAAIAAARSSGRAGSEASCIGIAVIRAARGAAPPPALHRATAPLLLPTIASPSGRSGAATLRARATGRRAPRAPFIGRVCAPHIAPFAKVTFCYKLRKRQVGRAFGAPPLSATSRKRGAFAKSFRPAVASAAMLPGPADP